MSTQLEVFLEQERIYNQTVLEASLRFVNATGKPFPPAKLMQPDRGRLNILLPGDQNATGERVDLTKFIDITPGKRTRSGKSY